MRFGYDTFQKGGEEALKKVPYTIYGSRCSAALAGRWWRSNRSLGHGLVSLRNDQLLPYTDHITRDVIALPQLVHGDAVTAADVIQRVP